MEELVTYAFNEFHLLPHAPQSPAMRPCDFWLRQSERKSLQRDTSFTSLGVIKENTAAMLDIIEQEKFEKCILIG